MHNIYLSGICKSLFATGFLNNFLPINLYPYKRSTWQFKRHYKNFLDNWSIIYSSCLYWIAYPVANYTNVPLIVAIACPILLGIYLGIYPSIFTSILFYNRNIHWTVKGLIAGLSWSSLEYIRTYFFNWISMVKYNPGTFILYKICTTCQNYR